MKNLWTVEKIHEGIERFKRENKRFPTAPEIDQIEYLPSSRWIQLKFGGLEKLRTTLGYRDVHYGKGTFRSEIAALVNTRGRDAERTLELILCERFGEVFVHTEKLFDKSKNRVDFYVYSPDSNFGVDVFYPSTMRSLQSNVNVKMGKYKNFPYTLYLVVANEDIGQTKLDTYVRSKIKVLPADTKIVTTATFVEIIKNMRNYPNPL